MFHTEPKNRRMTPWEQQEERYVAKLFGRAERTFILDKPFYPFVKTDVTKCVNFDLNYIE